MVKEVEQLRINPADYAYEITKRGKRDDSVVNHRIYRQKQEGLYYVEYHQSVAMQTLNISYLLLIMQ